MKNPIFLFKSPVNIKQQHEGLCAIVREKFGEDFIYSGAAFVFISRSRYIAKVLFYDGSGLNIVHKRFLVKAFGYAAHLDEVSKITIQELELLFSGEHLRISLKKKISNGPVSVTSKTRK